MLSLKDSLAVLKRTNALLEGHYVLSSGLHSSKYIQCAKLLSYPNLADNICKSLANKIKKIYGILNGTTNYILSEMEKSRKNFSEVLKNAKKLGLNLYEIGVVRNGKNVVIENNGKQYRMNDVGWLHFQ